MNFLFTLSILVLLVQCFCQTEQEDCEYKHGIRTYICRNIVDTFPNIFYGNYHLHCKNCNIRVFSKETMPFSNTLTSFNVSESGIQYILPEAFSNLGNSQYFYLQNNEITNISTRAFFGLTQVYEMHLENNLLVNLQPGFLDGLEAITILLHNNQITELPERIFMGASNILTLELQNNKIKKLHRNSFEGLESLEVLKLQNNKLCYIPLGIFQHLQTLRHLYLGNNKLSNFAIGTFSGLRNLNTLNLANNSISVFDGALLLPINRLSELDISGNRMYYFDANDLHSNVPTLKSLNIDGNLFSCSLLQNSIKFFKTVNVDIINSAPRYDLQNIQGILCTTDIFTEGITYEYFLRTVEEQTKMHMKYC